MMRPVLKSVSKRLFHSSPIAFAEASPATSSSSNALVLNFSTPHQSIYAKKTIDKVFLPGASGQYGITAGHSALISQLVPGVVTVIHTGGETERYFVPGGFAITSANAATDVSVPEAVPLSDFDESNLRAAYLEATKISSAAAVNSVEKAKALIEIEVYSALAKSMGVTI